MSWNQLRMWYLYSRIEPFGEQRADLRSGIVASTIANVNRDRKKRPKPFSPSDFMPKYGSGKSHGKPVTYSQWRRIKEEVRAWAEAK